LLIVAQKYLHELYVSPLATDWFSSILSNIDYILRSYSWLYYIGSSFSRNDCFCWCKEIIDSVPCSRRLFCFQMNMFRPFLKMLTCYTLFDDKTQNKQY